jgi:hypothetical protein
MKIYLLASLIQSCTRAHSICFGGAVSSTCTTRALDGAVFFDRLQPTLLSARWYSTARRRGLVNTKLKKRRHRRANCNASRGALLGSTEMVSIDLRKEIERDIDRYKKLLQMTKSGKART